MVDWLVTLCLAGACEAHVVPVGAADCAVAEAAAAGRVAAWEAAGLTVQDGRCAPVGEAGARLAFTEVAPGIWVHAGEVALSDAANAGDIGTVAVIVGDEAVAVVDSGGTRALGEAVVVAVRAITDRPIRHAILTHPHPDHVFGATALDDAGAQVVGHAALADALAVRADTYLARDAERLGAAFLGTAMPVVERAVAETETLDLGGRVLRLDPWPESHTEADLTVFDAATGTLIAGDLVVDTHIPTLDGSLMGWLGTLDALDSLGPAQVVPGHGAVELPGQAATAPVRRYLTALRDDLRAAIRDGVAIGDAAATAVAAERDRWALFDELNPRNATTGYAELEWE